ncbi:MAG: tannase/feruloyl esterase family alpha/beta hydrolase [Hydrogenophaga sp.]|uniref:tannase/feruloyl esterase family alpha/beta hydrolase n=1 Tax=Hydrogenophaga sp. TaxID=1904254 RepID=UPI002ABA5786|nr:tannase/feruloyl esterase family alpha/beta hydrolase [Hydrogenophaga sp.]MDZ4188188.1 tannase/feruloyl esterase family alpha/beta hydrolase [Hydrogenophaga sp.]
MKKRLLCASATLASVALVSACGGGDTPPPPPPPSATLPQLTPATAAPLVGTCDALLNFVYASTTMVSAVSVPAGTLRNHNGNPPVQIPVGEHCRVEGRMLDRTSPVDGQAYAIRFEMRLPTNWNGRFYYQGNGGLDGNLRDAIGDFGGVPMTNALQKGFAVISSDAGHNNESGQDPLFGVDPQARVDYGYGTVQKLTPLAKALIQRAYGKLPDRSYIGGTSNGARHAMVAAARLSDQYDGILANSPGFNLPKSAAAQLYTAQQWRKVATDETDLRTAFTVPERRLVANAILARCDALDGLADGMVQDIEGCRTAFNLFRDVPTCSGARDGPTVNPATCLSAAQKSAIDAMYYGPVNSRGEQLYATQPYDPGLVGNLWTSWKFTALADRDAPAVGVVFMSPPDATLVSGFQTGADEATITREFAFRFNFDIDYPKLFVTDGVYTESAMSFMTPPNPTNLATLRDRGGKMIVIHGASDGPFSIDDTRNWYRALNDSNGGEANRFARFYRVPGMNHSRAGPATDQYDSLEALIQWVEFGRAPDSILAQARGLGNPGGRNNELPADWAPDRTRPLCPYPQVARYNGTGDIERAENFSCR